MRAAGRFVAETTLVVGALGLVTVGVLQGYVPLRVGGSSMHPALHAGDLVLVRRHARVSVGDVVLIRAAGHGPVLHRAVGVLADGSVRTRGDANEVDDLEPAAPNSVAGVVVGHVPVGRLVERWRSSRAVGYHGGSTEQYSAMTETTSSSVSADQGRAP